MQYMYNKSVDIGERFHTDLLRYCYLYLGYGCDVEVHRLHVLTIRALMHEHKLYSNLKKCVFVPSEIPLRGCIYGRNGASRYTKKSMNQPTRLYIFRQGTSTVSWLCGVLAPVFARYAIIVIKEQ